MVGFWKRNEQPDNADILVGYSGPQMSTETR